MMKKGKFGKFLVGSAAIAATAAGAYYLYKNFINKDYTDDFDDFDDDFDDEFFDDITSDDLGEPSEDEATREYVSININDLEDIEDTETSEVQGEDTAKTTEEDVVAEEVDTAATNDISKDL